MVLLSQNRLQQILSTYRSSIIEYQSLFMLIGFIFMIALSYNLLISYIYFFLATVIVGYLLYHSRSKDYISSYYIGKLVLLLGGCLVCMYFFVNLNIPIRVIASSLYLSVSILLLLSIGSPLIFQKILSLVSQLSSSDTHVYTTEYRFVTHFILGLFVGSYMYKKLCKYEDEGEFLVTIVSNEFIASGSFSSSSDLASWIQKDQSIPLCHTCDQHNTGNNSNDIQGNYIETVGLTHKLSHTGHIYMCTDCKENLTNTILTQELCTAEDLIKITI